MPKIVVVGGGLVGMAAGMMLARDGCEVTVLERDGGPVPGSPVEAWQDWDRRGIAQHMAPARLQVVRLPELRDAAAVPVLPGLHR